MPNSEISLTWISKDFPSDSDKINDGTDNSISEPIHNQKPQLSNWPPASRISEETFFAIPTYIDYDGYVYLHSIKESMLL